MTDEHEKILRELFGEYRSEWPQELFGSLFIRPAYFSKLETNRPCILVGGRGTGKTTTLKSLRFDAAAARTTGSESLAGSLTYLGVYVRMNKNRVPVFQGPELLDGEWQRAFSHYFNLLVLIELCELTAWLVTKQVEAKRPINLAPVAETLGLAPPAGVVELQGVLQSMLSKLELFVNNPRGVERPLLSIAEKPIRVFAEELDDSGLLNGRLIYCCVDEYENLLDYQQSVLNTYIKHSEPPLSYKIGVRKNGLRTRATNDKGDPLVTPDDYSEIDIVEEGFDLFAPRVLELRLQRARERGVPVPTSAEAFLPELSLRDEAKALGSDRISEQVVQELRNANDPSLAAWASSQSPAELFFVKYWAEGQGTSVTEQARDWMLHPEQWRNRLGNHLYASLFWLSKGRKGAGIKKYYCGNSTFLILAAGNVRYFLALIDESLAEHFSSKQDLVDGQLVLSPRAQTEAAKTVGQRRLDALEGLSEHGVELKRLVLTIGKIFFELARDPVGRTPETNHFVLSGAADDRERMARLLSEGVAHQAFEVTPRTKATSPQQIRDDEYRLHPIFCAFFQISHRKKRRITLEAKPLLRLAEDPSGAMADLLAGVTMTPIEELPVQLAMFSSFYDGGTKDESGS